MKKCLKMSKMNKEKVNGYLMVYRALLHGLNKFLFHSKIKKYLNSNQITINLQYQMKNNKIL